MGRSLNKMLTRRHGALITFAAAIFTAALLFTPFIIYGGGIFWYYGDFNAQEIPFYQLIHSAVREGNLGWSHLTDLGSDTVASYSFYLLGSPFFWLTIPFPNEFVPYLMGPLMILKFGCAALSAYFYLKRYVSDILYAVLGGLLYAFSGFSIYNVFFFHFHEPMIIFPLMLAALDAFLYDKRRGLFAVTVFAACVINYYFFVGQSLFLLMYFLMLTFSKVWKFSVKEFLLLACEVFIGFAATAFILLPSVLGILGNPRLNSLPSGWDALVYKKPQRYFLILLSFFFPSDKPAFPVFTPDSNAKWCSAAGWLPLFGMTGVIAYLQLRRRSWLKKLLTLLMLMAFIPALNCAFQLFNNSIFYARWFYMPVLMMTLATLRACEDLGSEADWRRAFTWSVGITFGLTLLIGLMPNFGDAEDERTFKIGVEKSYGNFWIYCGLAMASLLLLAILYTKFRGRGRLLPASLTAGALTVALITSYVIIGYGVLASNTTDAFRNDILNSRDDIEIDDLEEVRSDFYECKDNTAMYWKVQSINCFQSSVSPSIMKFYNSLGITRDVASRPDYSSYGLRPFLSTKYLFDYTVANDGSHTKGEFIEEDGQHKMPGWKLVKICNNFNIYENENYIPMGYCFDSFITKEEFEQINSTNRPQALLYAMVLDRGTMEKYSSITGYTDEAYSKLYGENPRLFVSKTKSYVYNPLSYTEACDSLKSRACESFEYTDDGFKAVYDNLGGENLLFFTVPYSDGFTTFVNGEETEIVKADYGFMAVKVPAEKKSEIKFTYRTPGADAGIAISLCALVAYILYMAAVIIFKVKNRGQRKKLKYSRYQHDD